MTYYILCEEVETVEDQPGSLCETLQVLLATDVAGRGIDVKAMVPWCHGAMVPWHPTM